MTHISYVQRDTLHPIPQKIDRDLQREFKDYREANQEPLTPTQQREQANARLINWGSYKRRESHTIKAITSSGGQGQIYKIMQRNVASPPPPPPREIDIDDAVIVERYVSGLTEKNKEVAEYFYEKQYGRELVARMTNLTEDAVKSRLRTMKSNLK